MELACDVTITGLSYVFKYERGTYPIKRGSSSFDAP